MTVHHVTLDQGRIPALMIHCALADHTSLLPLARRLPDLRPTLIDLLGHGQSPAPRGEDDLRDNAAAAAACFDPPEPGWVIGHSYGAVTALRVALDHPDRVPRLVLIEPVLFAAADGTPEGAAYHDLFAPVRNAFAADDLDRAGQEFLKIWGRGVPQASHTPGARPVHAQSMPFIRKSAADLEQDRTGLLDPGKLEALSCPVLLIRGSDSPAVVRAIHRTLLSRLPQAEELVLNGADHMVAVTHHRDIAKHLKTLRF